ncbi:hypothetical protein [Streptomyces sp. SM13]|uniref:hypothetical protein n=1 Tax=Streptomyces sp. SM13 TaxID=1983803 RepID=UPI000CD4A1CA|nr:hypothetical protein [Streptomyces sp. SM13]
MRSDPPLVPLQQEDPPITALPREPLPQQVTAGMPGPEHGYDHLTAPLRERGLECTVEYGLSDYIVHADLPDGSSLIISPPQEPPTDHPPGRPESWLVTRRHPDDSTVHEVIYDSEPGGPHAQHGGNAVSLLTAIDGRLDQLGVPPRPDAASSRVSAARALSPSVQYTPAAPRSAASAVRPVLPPARVPSTPGR